MRVGLTGGIGSGKTTVAERLRELGALVIDADELARQALESGTDALERVLRRWPQTRSEDGGLDRAALAAIVFADPVARAELNGIVHPVVRRLAARMESRSEESQIVVHDVPLLFESGFDRRCDATVLVVAPYEKRLERVAARSSLDVEEIRRRMAAQIDPAVARKRATFTIDNDGTLDDLRRATDSVWQRLRQVPGGAGP